MRNPKDIEYNLDVVCINPSVLLSFPLSTLKTLCSINWTFFKYVSRILSERYKYRWEHWDLTRFVHTSPKRIQTSSLQHPLPRNITHLILPATFNEPIDGAALPQSLVSIFFGRDFNHPISNLPSSITTLQFGCHYKVPFMCMAGAGEFNQSVDNLPPNLTSLTIGGYMFNQSIDYLPDTLTELHLGHGFDSPVNNLPPYLTHLTFSFKFNQPIEYLPSHLTHLTFGTHFNQPLPNLPATLTHLTLSQKYNKPLKLPAHLVFLSIGSFYTHPLNSIPSTLTHITIWTHSPSTITSLVKQPPTSLSRIFVPPRHALLQLQKCFHPRVKIETLEYSRVV